MTGKPRAPILHPAIGSHEIVSSGKGVVFQKDPLAIEKMRICWSRAGALI